MHSVFSNYLEPLYPEAKDLYGEMKPSEIYDQLRIAYNQGAKGILESTRLISSTSEDENYQIIEAVWSNEELHKIVKWINQKITLIIGIADYRTIDVRMRIAINMMDKLVDSGIISSKLNLIVFGNLISNVRQELSLIGTEDLPF
jgi:hypothetical protein